GFASPQSLGLTGRTPDPSQATKPASTPPRKSNTKNILHDRTPTQADFAIPRAPIPQPVSSPSDSGIHHSNPPISRIPVRSPRPTPLAKHPHPHPPISMTPHQSENPIANHLSPLQPRSSNSATPSLDPAAALNSINTSIPQPRRSYYRAHTRYELNSTRPVPHTARKQK
ncbi:hypothetical protein CVT24_003796, partial [Panaeolus cyanescens]